MLFIYFSKISDTRGGGGTEPKLPWILAPPYRTVIGYLLPSIVRFIQVRTNACRDGFFINFPRVYFALQTTDISRQIYARCASVIGNFIRLRRSGSYNCARNGLQKLLCIRSFTILNRTKKRAKQINK